MLICILTKNVITSCSVTMMLCLHLEVFFFSSRRRHTRLQGDWSSDVCSSDLGWASAPVILALLVAAVAAVLFYLGERRAAHRSEERRGGEECRSRGLPYH